MTAPAFAQEVTIGAFGYRYGRLNALQQFHVLRRLAPVLPGFGKLLKVAEVLGRDRNADLGAHLGDLQPLMQALAQMPEADADYVLDKCLDQVRRVQGNQLARVRANGQLMFQDLTLPEMLQLVVAVLAESLTDFFPAPSGSATPPTSPPG